MNYNILFYKKIYNLFVWFFLSWIKWIYLCGWKLGFKEMNCGNVLE